MQLFQIPFSHNCVKVRRALDLKGLDYETVDINPARRGDVKRASGQELVPVLVEDGRSTSGSTQILLDVEERHPDPPLLPEGERERAECVLLMEWADGELMALTRRMAYFRVLSGTRADLGKMFFPAVPQRCNASVAIPPRSCCDGGSESQRSRTATTSRRRNAWPAWWSTASEARTTSWPDS